jgi:cytochrome c556
MRKLPALLGVFAIAGTAAFAEGDPVATRIALMDANGAATALAGAMLKEQVPYSPAAGKAAIMSWHGVAVAVGSFFPEGSEGKGHSKAAPKIWEDRAGFEADLAKFQDATAAAVEASGKDGPADLAAFKTVAQPVMGTCKTCHEAFRLSDD